MCTGGGITITLPISTSLLENDTVQIVYVTAYFASSNVTIACNGANIQYSRENLTLERKKQEGKRGETGETEGGRRRGTEEIKVAKRWQHLEVYLATLNQQSQAFKDSFGCTIQTKASATVEDAVCGLYQQVLLMQHLNYGAAEVVAMEAVAVSSQIDRRLADLTLLEQFKQRQDVNTQSVQAVQQYVAVSDVLAVTAIQVL